MHIKFLAFVLATSFLVMDGCSEQKAISEDIKTSEVSETEDNIYRNTKTINKDIFSKLTKQQQKSIKDIIDNIEDYDEDGVIPKNIDKENFAVFEGYYEFAVELGKENNKIVILVSKCLGDNNKLEVYDIHTSKDILEVNNLPKLGKVHFLSNEQKLLYKDAVELLFGVYMVPTIFCDYDRIEEKDNAEIRINIPGDDEPYIYVLVENDKFVDYNGFKSYVYSIFTKDFWDRIETNSYSFEERGGKLYCKAGGRNGNITYLGVDENKYELISKTENKIEFYDICCYSSFRGIEGAKPEWTQVVKNKAVLEKIDGEWKFTELVLPG